MMTDDFNINVLGRSIRGFNLDSAIHDCLKLWWDHPQYDGYLTSDYRISITRETGNPTKIPDQFSIDFVRRDLPLKAVDLDDEIWICGENCFVKATFDHKTCAIWYWGAFSTELVTALDHMIAEAMTASGLIGLHASIAAQNNKATAFLGPSGRGKTTTLLWAIKSGWQPVSEDFSWMDPESLMVFGWGKTMRLLPDSYALLRSWYPDIESNKIDRGKHILFYSDLGMTVIPAKIERFVWLERDSNSSSILSDQASSQKAMMMWVAAGLTIKKSSLSSIARVISEIVLQLDFQCMNIGKESLPLYSKLIISPLVNSNCAII